MFIIVFHFSLGALDDPIGAPRGRGRRSDSAEFLPLESCHASASKQPITGGVVGSSSNGLPLGSRGPWLTDLTGLPVNVTDLTIEYH